MSSQLPGRQVAHAGHAHVLHGRGEDGVLAVSGVAVLGGGLHVHVGEQGAGVCLVMLG